MTEHEERATLKEWRLVMTHLFRNRTEAGRELAAALMKFADREDVIVLGLPRGGVAVALEVSKKLNVPLDVFVVRKLGVPGYPELAMGAIATGHVRVLNLEVVRGLGISQITIDSVAAKEEQELRRRELAYRGNESSPDLRGKTVILVDDGIATGSTMRAAVQAVRQQDPAHLVVAVPTAAPGSYAEVKRQVDEIVALMTPGDFYAVGQWYEDFAQITDAEVTEFLELAGHGSKGSQALNETQANSR